MPQQSEPSLSDQETFAGENDTDARSLGDAMTIGAGGLDTGNAADTHLDLVDLSTRYTFERLLGKGGMGEVVLAVDTRLRRQVAIKRVSGDKVDNSVALARFLTEAQSVAALNHPNIVQIYDFGRDENGPFLIMEYVDGMSLLTRCQQGALAPDEAIHLACQLCDGLEKAHNAGIWHRDIKPANVLLTSDGIPKLTDFGLAKYEAADTGLSVAGAVLGTLDFMPLEQRKDAALVDDRSDLWSLAATLYQMVTGRSPKVIRFTNVPEALQDVLGKALEDAKDDRYQSAGEFRDALRNCLKIAAPVSAVRVPAAPVLPGSGECQQCRTQNEPARKFCRECAAPLRVQCLQCETEIPVWEKVCGDCGCKQHEILDKRRTEIDALHTRAQTLRDGCDFDNAVAAARQIAAVEDIRLQHLKDWSEQFIADTLAEQQRQEENATEQYAAAKAHFEARDYRATVDAINTIPEALRSDEAGDLLQQAQANHEELNQLTETITARVDSRDLDGLLELVERAIELQGEQDDLLLLKAELVERRMTLYHQQLEVMTIAESLFDEGQAEEALQRMESVDDGELEPSFAEFRTRLQKINQAEIALQAMVKEANADGVLDPVEVAGLFRAADEYLKLNSRHQKIIRLRDQLSQRILKSPQDYAGFKSLAGFWPSLPSHVLANLPMSLMSRFPDEVIDRFPREVMTRLPHSFQERVKARNKKALLKRNRVPENLSRDELKQWVRETEPDIITQCPVCGVELKVSSLIRHTDQQHR